MKFNRIEIQETVRLALPLVFAELGWMSMGIVDTMFVGRVNAEAIGAVGIGTTFFYTIASCAGGLLLGLDTLVAQAAGRRDPKDAHSSIAAGLWLAVVLSILVMTGVSITAPELSRIGINPAVLEATMPYVRVLNWSTLPLLVFFALRRYLQSFGVVRPIMFTLLGANIANAIGDWLLVQGHWGAPRLGAVGAGWATFASRMVMAICLIVVTLRREPDFLRNCWRFEVCRVRELLRLGIPAAMQMGLEFIIWTTATLLAGRFAPAILAAHQIALTTVSTTFMVPLGISSAAAVRVGHAIGRDDSRSASASGWTAILLGTCAMALSALVLLVFPEAIVRMFTPDSAILAGALPILRCAAFFQLFDGFQVITTGALRGAGDTRTPALCHFTGYWLLGFPIGYWLAFENNILGSPMQVTGLWIGLSVGVITIGAVLLAVWARSARRYTST